MPAPEERPYMLARYKARDGSEYLLRGHADDGRWSRKINCAGFQICATRVGDTEGQSKIRWPLFAVEDLDRVPEEETPSLAILRRRVARAGLSMVCGDLDEGVPPADQDIFFFDSEKYITILNRHEHRAPCDKLLDQPPDMLCKAAQPPQATTLADCEDCEWPEVWQRCAHAVNPELHLVPSEHPVRRWVAAACNLRKCDDATKCRPLAKECFEPTVLVSPTAPCLDVARVRQAVSEVNAAWEDTFGTKWGASILWSPPSIDDERRVFNPDPCADQHELQTRLLALASVIGSVDRIHEIRAELERTGGPQEDLNRDQTLETLRRYLDAVEAVNAGGEVRELQRLRKLRNLDPVHPADTKAARQAEIVLRELGHEWRHADFDPGRAWADVLDRYSNVLHALAAALRQEWPLVLAPGGTRK